MATRRPRGQNVDFYHLMGAKSSRDNVALATAHVMAAEYYKETIINQLKNISEDNSLVPLSIFKLYTQFNHF